jgi:site-specific recombinase XerC
LKLPDQLPRAIDAQDLSRLLSVIDNIRDRALILVLLRTYLPQAIANVIDGIKTYFKECNVLK